MEENTLNPVTVDCNSSAVKILKDLIHEDFDTKGVTSVEEGFFAITVKREEEKPKKTESKEIRILRDKLFELKIWEKYKFVKTEEYTIITLFNFFKAVINNDSKKVSYFKRDEDLDWVEHSKFAAMDLFHIYPVRQIYPVSEGSDRSNRVDDVLNRMFSSILETLVDSLKKEKSSFVFSQQRNCSPTGNLIKLSDIATNNALRFNFDSCEHWARPMDMVKAITYSKYSKIFKNTYYRVQMIESLVPEGGKHKSIISAIFGRRVILENVLFVLRNYEDLLRIYNENRNLMCLVRFIPEDMLKDNALFSKKMWTEKNGKSPIKEQTGIGGFDSVSGFRLFLNLKPQSARTFYSSRYILNGRTSEINYILDMVSKTNTNINKKNFILLNRVIHTIIAYPREISQFASLPCSEEKKAHLLRAYINFLDKRRLALGNHRFNRTPINYDEGFGYVMDFINDDLENCPQIFNKHSTWKTLLGLSEKWHREINLKRIKEEENHDWSNNKVPENLSFYNKKLEFDGFVFEPILNYYDLAIEGETMQHCIRSYWKDCKSSQYFVFKAKKRGQENATIGVLRGLRGDYKVEQIRGKYNADLSSIYSSPFYYAVKEYQDNMKKMIKKDEKKSA